MDRLTEKPSSTSIDESSLRAFACLDQRRFERETARTPGNALDENDPRLVVSSSVDGAQPLRLQTSGTQLGEKRGRLDGRIHQENACSAARETAGGIEEHAQRTATRARPRGRRRAAPTGLDVRRIADDEVGGPRRDGGYVADVGAQHVDAISPSVGDRIRLGDLRERGIDLDHRDVVGSAEVEQRKPHRSYACAEIERSTRPSGATRFTERARGKGRKQHGIHIDAITAASRGLRELDPPAEQRVLRRPHPFTGRVSLSF